MVELYTAADLEAHLFYLTEQKQQMTAGIDAKIQQVAEALQNVQRGGER